MYLMTHLFIILRSSYFEMALYFLTQIHYVFIFGVIMFIYMLYVFIYVFYTGYIQNMQDRYLRFFANRQ